MTSHLPRRLARYFVRGLVLTVPAALTIWLSWVAIRWVDGLLGVRFPGVGLLATLVAVTLIGALASSYVARAVLGSMEGLFERLPFVRLLYSSTKDLLNAFVGEERRFKRPVRVALTEDGSVSVLGFVTSEALADLGLAGQVAVYLPQSYNFAGNLIVVPAARVTPLTADSTEVMAFIVSGGVSRAGAKAGPTGGDT